MDARDSFSPKLNHSSVEQAQARVFTKAANLLIRMIKGEERNKEIWDQLKNLFLKLFSAQGGKEIVAENGLKDLETKSIAAILKTLGYMEEAPASGKGLISAINRAIKESML